MIGHGYTGGYQPIPEQEIFKKWAYFPRKTTSGKWIWLKSYYCIATYYDENGKPPVKSLAWYNILTEPEYLLYLLKHPSKK